MMMILRDIILEKSNKNDNKIIFSYSFNKKDFFSFLGNNNELNFEIFLCKYIFFIETINI